MKRGDHTTRREVEWPGLAGETPIDVSGLKPRGVRTRADLNRVEAENVRKAVVRYLASTPTRRQAPFDLAWCLRLHKHMFGDIWRWAGTVRRSELNMGVPAHRVEMDLHALLEDLAYWREHEDMPIVEQATRLHHRAVSIHPFLNGNGRWSRMLANIYLKQRKAGVIVWPESTIGDASVIRGEYLVALREADRGEIGALIALHERYLVAG